MQNKNSQWFIFFCAILYNKNLKKNKNKMPNTFSMQCLPFLFLVLKAKEIKKERHIVSTNEVRNHFYLHFWFNKIFIKLLMHCVLVFRKKKKESTASNSDDGVLCLAPSLSIFFPNYTITESCVMRLWFEVILRKKNCTFFNDLVDLLLLSIIVIFHLFSTIRRVISNNKIVLSEIGVI